MTNNKIARQTETTTVYGLYLNEIRGKLAAGLERSPSTHRDGYEPAGDRPTLFARFPLGFVPFIKHPG